MHKVTKKTLFSRGQSDLSRSNHFPRVIIAWSQGAYVLFIIKPADRNQRLFQWHQHTYNTLWYSIYIIKFFSRFFEFMNHCFYVVTNVIKKKIKRITRITVCIYNINLTIHNHTRRKWNQTNKYYSPFSKFSATLVSKLCSLYLKNKNICY